MTENNIIIFGAGPSGMAAAFELSNNKRKVTIIEKNDTIGGLGRTFHYVILLLIWVLIGSLAKINTSMIS